MRHQNAHAAPSSPPAAYCIRVQGRVDPRWSDWFNGLTLTEAHGPGDQPVTTLAGVVPDQAALRGILNKLWDLNLTLIAIERLERPMGSEGSHERHTDAGARRAGPRRETQDDA